MNTNKNDIPKSTVNDGLRARTRSGGQAPVTRQRRGLFLFADILLLAGILCSVLLLVLAFTPLSLFGDGAQPREILYTVEFAGVDQSYLSAFREGDVVTDAATGEDLGVVAQIKIREYEAYTNIPTPEVDPEIGKHTVRKETNENLKTVTVVLRVTAEYTEGVGYQVEQTRIAVGGEYQFRFPSYTDKGECIALEYEEVAS